MVSLHVEKTEGRKTSWEAGPTTLGERKSSWINVVAMRTDMFRKENISSHGSL